MFTGIIETQGILHALCEISEQSTYRAIIKSDLKNIIVGESIAINGICLTVSAYQNDLMFFDISVETINSTTLKLLKSGDIVNIERAMLASTRFGGHYVTGHVDTIAIVKNKTNIYNCTEIVIGDFINNDNIVYVVLKGSIAIDGTSLTIQKVCNDNITVTIVPYTLSQCILHTYTVGQHVNVEFDYFSKIISKYLETHRKL